MTAVAQSSLVTRWRQRFGGQRRNRGRPRPFAALGYLVNGPVIENLVEIENLVLVVLYDEPQPDSRLALRLSGFGGARMPWGVKWGGPELSKFYKDVLLQPESGAHGLRVDVTRTRLPQLAMQLDGQIQRHCRRPWLVRRSRPQLPRLWAGFRASVINQITGDGPELAAESRRTGKPAGQLFQDAWRTHEGLSLHPLPWVSHQEELATAVFADLGRFPRRQVFSVKNLPEDLQGFQGAAQFDFHGNRFRATTSRSFQTGAKQLAMPVAV